MQVEYLSIPVVNNEKSQEVLNKTFNGKWPVLELQDGTCVSESLAIAKFFSDNKLNFYGPSASSKAQIN
jgi:glutathione S-transferase